MLIVHFHLSLGLQSGFFSSDFPTNFFFFAFTVAHMHATGHAHPILLMFISLITLSEFIRVLLFIC
jgi:hypothetical protein